MFASSPNVLIYVNFDMYLIHPVYKEIPKPKVNDYMTLLCINIYSV